LVTYCLSEFCKKHKLSPESTKELRSNPRAKRSLRTECERVKKTLSSSTSDTVFLNSFFEGKDLNVPVTRAKFEDLCKDEWDRCMKPLDEALRNAKLAKKDIADIVLVGGS